MNISRELGGLRGKARGTEPSPNAYWRVRGFRNYADYALTEPFAAGLARLRELGGQHRCAIMCAEAVWWRCHRRIITDYLLSEGERVMHILGTVACRRGKPDTRSRSYAATAGSSIRAEKSAVGIMRSMPPLLNHHAMRKVAMTPTTARPSAKLNRDHRRILIDVDCIRSLASTLVACRGTAVTIHDGSSPS